jgi:Helicase HerA, central domain
VKIILGQDDFLLSKNQSFIVHCDFDRLVNAHMLIMGKTGMGKTMFLRSIIQQMYRFSPTPRIHIMDVHGDIDIEGASSIRFSESTDYGLNPFVVSADPHFGGVRKKVQDFIATINGCRSIGSRQEAVMRHLITDLYSANGFFSDNHKSWVLEDGYPRKYPKRYPTMDDACRFSFGKLKQLIIGSDSVSGRALEELNKVTTKLYKISKQHSLPGTVLDERLTEAIEHRATAIRAYKEYIENLETGKELEDFIKYESKEVLKSVVERFENLKASGIFKNHAAPFDLNNAVWHYDITALREDEKRMFVEFRLQELFSDAMENGPMHTDSKGLLRDIIAIDEAHLFFRDDQNNILNTIAKEGRKFGLGLICSSQSPTHFSEDFFSNVATKVVLGVDQMYWDNLVRKMKIEPKCLKYVKPFHVVGVQMNTKGDTRSRFTMVRLPNAQANQINSQETA